MQTSIENALMIVAAGNASIAGRAITNFWPDAPTFRYISVCDFRRPPATGNVASEYPLVAADPNAWFRSLKPWCKGLRLVHTPSVRGPNQQIDAPDRMLVSFVGGGPRWLIEAVGEERSELWEAFQRHAGKGASREKPWSATHILQGHAAPGELAHVDLRDALVVLRIVLPEIEAYARAQSYTNFADLFATAQKLLDRSDVDPAPWVDEMLRYSGLNRAQLAIHQAVRNAWVFGGMGSWNDLGDGGEPYESLSERLFVALNDTVAGLANSTYAGG